MHRTMSNGVAADIFGNEAQRAQLDSSRLEDRLTGASKPGNGTHEYTTADGLTIRKTPNLVRSRLTAFIILLLATWIGFPVLTIAVFGTLEKGALIGEACNIVSSLFSGLALLGVVYTLQQQRQEARSREDEFRYHQAAAARQIFHLALATKLQTVQALIEERRRAVVELRPRTDVVPRSELKLRSLRVCWESLF